MKIKIPAIAEPLHLSEYHEAMGDEVLWVWVNLSAAKRKEYREIIRDASDAFAELVKTEADERESMIKQVEELTNKVYAWWADILSQGDEQWDAEQVRELGEQDSGFWEWFVTRYWTFVDEWREEQKKKAKGKPSKSSAE